LPKIPFLKLSSNIAFFGELKDPSDQIGPIHGLLAREQFTLHLPIRICGLGDEEMQVPKVAGDGYGILVGGLHETLAAHM
jgi:hypothetical protein